MINRLNEFCYSFILFQRQLRRQHHCCVMYGISQGVFRNRVFVSWAKVYRSCWHRGYL
ncbi:hypothetical protein OIU78_019401 [Salix suchowensis]|nr:hypothetical protein OIU78_019401 [Salix suchowensis]